MLQSCREKCAYNLESLDIFGEKTRMENHWFIYITKGLNQ